MYTNKDGCLSTVVRLKIRQLLFTKKRSLNFITSITLIITIIFKYVTIGLVTMATCIM